MGIVINYCFMKDESFLLNFCLASSLGVLGFLVTKKLLEP